MLSSAFTRRSPDSCRFQGQDRLSDGFGQRQIAFAASRSDQQGRERRWRFRIIGHKIRPSRAGMDALRSARDMDAEGGPRSCTRSYRGTMTATHGRGLGALRCTRISQPGNLSCGAGSIDVLKGHYVTQGSRPADPVRSAAEEPTGLKVSLRMSGIGASRPCPACRRSLLTGPTAAAQPYRRELVFMPHYGHCRDETATAQSGGEPIFESITASSASVLAISHR